MSNNIDRQGIRLEVVWYHVGNDEDTKALDVKCRRCSRVWIALASDRAAHGALECPNCGMHDTEATVQQLREISDDEGTLEFIPDDSD